MTRDPTLERPRLVRIHGLMYPIEFVASRKDHHLFRNRKPRAWGCVVQKLRLIKIKHHAPLDMQRETLLHEILHAIVYASGFDKAITEQHITVLARSLFGTLTDNRQVVRWLFGRLR